MKKKLIFCTLILLLSTCLFTKTFAQETKPIVVLVKYKTLPGKEKEALTALKALVEKVKKEPYYIGIDIHVDQQDENNILLYEQWSNEDYYKGAHMQTEQLQQFIKDSRAFLGGAPDISFWKKAS